jgi:hypothetical protein
VGTAQARLCPRYRSGARGTDSSFKQPAPSLRANGSRERAPDDRLREAIHFAAKEVWIASAFALELRRTGRRYRSSQRRGTNCRHGFAISPRVFARVFAINVPPKENEGAGNAGRTMRPQPRVRNETKHTSVVTTVTPEQPGIPRAMVLTVSFVLPGDEFVLVTIGLEGFRYRIWHQLSDP